MKTLSEAFGFEKKDEIEIVSSGDIKELSDGGTQVVSVTLDGKPKSKKEGDNINRVKPVDLETIYMRNATIFNGINKIDQTIMSAGNHLECSNKKTLEKYEKFLDNIGNTGCDMSWDDLNSRWLIDECVYGHGWGEIIYNKDMTKIVDLDVLDAKKMDYLKDSTGNIKLDQSQRPVGYTQKLPYNVKIDGLGDPWPADVQPQSGMIFLKPERIIHFKLYTIGDGFYPVGLIEPAYNPALWKLNIEKGLANFIYMSGFPTRVAKVGDPNHEPTPQQVQNILEKLKDINFKQNIAIPYYNDITLLEAKNAEKMQDHLNYFREQEITGLGIPKPFATGGGEETNRATLGNQDRMFKLTLRDLMRKHSATIKRQLFMRIAKLEGYNVVPDMVWGDIEEVDSIDKTKIILEAVKDGVIKPEEARPMIMKMIEEV